jgi:hypothetical protein
MFIVPEQTQSKAKRLGVPSVPELGVEVTITKYEYFPATGNQLEKAVLTFENDEVPHYHDFTAPKESQIGIRTSEIKNFSKECGVLLPEKKEFNSYKEFCDYYLAPTVNTEGRVKIVYSKNEVVYNPQDEALMGKSEEEIKKLRKPYTKTGKMPYFFRKGNDKKFTIVSKGDQWDDFVDYTTIAKTPDTDFGVPAINVDDLAF